MLDDRAAIYNLVRTLGGPGTLYHATKTVAQQTGLVSQTLVPYRLKKLLKLPAKNVYSMSQTVGSGPKVFSYIKTTISFLLLASDLPTGVLPKLGYYIVRNAIGYTIDEVDDSAYEGGFVCHCTKISGDVPKQVHQFVMKDILTFDENLEAE